MNNPCTTPGFADPAGTWNQRFAGADYLFGKEPNAFLRQQLKELPRGGRVLCVADGEGRNSVWLACQGMRVDAFDISEVGLAKAQRLADVQGVKVNFAQADCETLEWPKNTYDAVVAIFIQFAHPALRSMIFAGMQRCLKPEGVIILQGYTPRQLEFKTGGPPCANHLYTRDLLREEFEAMDTMQLHEYDAEIEEGTGHKGRSALIGMVARKAG